jgi:predicted TIM-barrel fold metal-dependent hydrolase
MESTPQMPSLRSLELFDGCVTFGQFVSAGCAARITRENVLSVLDRYGIAEAMVHHEHARIVHPRSDGNRRLLEEIRGLSRLHPVWVIHPPREGGRAAAARLVGEMREAGVKAARLPFRTLPPMEWVWGDLLAELEERRLPCFCDFGTVSTIGELTDSDVSGLREIAVSHPRLPLIVSHVMGGLGLHPAVPHLVRQARNVLIDITGIMDFARKIAREVGPEKVLFATGMPFTDPGILVGTVQYDEVLDERAKRLVCGGNLRGILEQVR